MKPHIAATEEAVLDAVAMTVSATTSASVVDGATRLVFSQRGARVLGRYQGGSICRGLLVGTLSKGCLEFRYCQVEASGAIHGGRSNCDVTRNANGTLRLIEQFRWRTRAGAGTNVFDEAS
jgi:hypothetical protein